ncbi:restriction endonuclease [Paenibacillus alvei TS-15]|uniref:Restriction endonuclease n=2 Tax=Paenibacillus alvei TaxID=44250 RepID=S9SI53_PAEAL|nr:restriction endonuclease [Paenibacillus alvei TS-15]
MGAMIEIGVSDNVSTTEKGRLLETLGREVLETMQYDVIEEVRLTGIEVDLLAKHKMTSEVIYVECKAYKDTNTISADVITKLLGNVHLKRVSSGWLLSTGSLGKDAKGIVEEWEQQPSEQRKLLQIYSPDKLVNLIVNSGKVCNPLSLEYPSNGSFSDNVTLLITNLGRFWAVPLIHVNAGIPYAVMLFDAKTGEPISNHQIIDSVSKIPSSFHDLEWLYPNVIINDNSLSDQLTKESESIITVSSGDQWADYRPSRPQDFVGRDGLLQDVYKFVDNVRNSSINTRLLALKAPSGWGKSSVLLKLVEKSKTSRQRNKNFVYAVDVRAATSHRYAEFSLIECLNSAIKENFVAKPSTPIKISDTNNPLSDQSIIEIIQTLKSENKVIMLMFDQFEEIFSKKELFPLFESIRRLSIAVDSLQENLIIGFAWKTDGTVPTDHPAYHLWHGLSDRRREFPLNPFVDKDILKALNIFSKELGEPLNPILKGYLKDHCQGYPWLLKKLCIHVFSLVQGGNQDEILGKSLNINELFEKETSELSSIELACVKKVAQDSPVELFQMVETYGDSTIQSLINKRIILRKGQKLILYWDIFRDYILTGKVPYIPVTYIPQTQFRRYSSALHVLIDHKSLTIPVFASKLGIGRDAAENIVRDFVMLGNASRQGDNLKFLHENVEEAYKKVVDFFTKHIMYTKIIEKNGINFQITVEDFEDYFNESYESYSEKTKKLYINRINGWLIGVGFIEIKANKIINAVDSMRGFSKNGFPKFSSGKRIRNANFLGEAPPDRVLELIRLINMGQNNESALKQTGLRNAISLLNSIGGLSIENGILSITHKQNNMTHWLAKTVLSTPTMEIVKKHGDKSSIELGNIISTELNKSWIKSSQKRYGSALILWYKWATEALMKDTVSV